MLKQRMSAGPGIRCLSACHGTQMGAGMELGKMLDGENKAGAVMMLDDRPGELLEEAKPFINLMMQYKCAIMEVETKFRVLDAEFSLEYNRNPFESIKSRLKSPLSIYEKLRRKGYPVTVENIEKHLNDVAGIRVICSFPDDIYRLADLISKQDDIEVLGRKDYIKNPKPNGYRSLHLILGIPIFLSREKKFMRVEVQLRTIAVFRPRPSYSTVRPILIGFPLLIIVCAAQCYMMGVSVMEFLYAFPVWALMVYIVLVLLVINGIYMLASKKIRDDVIVEAIKDDTV